MTLPEERERALRLLEETHEFPCDYYLTVIVMNDEAVVAEVRMAVDLGLAAGADPVRCETVPSRASKYLSLRLTVSCQDADAVLALHARVKVIKGVVRVM